MSKNTFNLDHWFLSEGEKKSLRENLKKKSKSPEEILAPFHPDQKDNPSALMQQYFVPGWTGESLISKNVKEFKVLLEVLKNDAYHSLKSRQTFPKKHIQQFFEEFISLSHFLNLNLSNLDSAQTFWEQLRSGESENEKELDLFCHILSYRIAVIFLLKARFIITLNFHTGKKFNIRDVVYPLGYLGKFFKSASSTELKSKAFEQNIYSWYKPSERFNERLNKFNTYCLELTITDIIKTVSIGSERILKAKTDYSHSLSHKQFGLFLNNLLINFPLWLESLRKKNQKKFTTQSGVEIISCKYQGDNVESLSLSHWLAQDSNKHLKWEQILCPDFTSDDTFNGSYLNIINEIQFLTFLADISKEQGLDAKTYISQVANSHLNNRKNAKTPQRNFFSLEQSSTELTYDRVIVNLSQYPKNNPHHFVFTQLTRSLEELKNDGYVYLLTSKKLFIPSQKDKVEALLQDLKLEGVFNFEELKGKGEVANFLYIFKKKNPLLPKENKNTKECCYNFRFSAELESFHNFRDLSELIQNFYIDNFKDLPPLYQKHTTQTRLEFFQDAIANGQLIHSSSKDTKNITHPHFFERLMKTCHPLSYFYEIQPVDFDKQEEPAEESLFDFSSSFKKDTSEFCLIVDKRNRDNIKIEMIHSSTLEAVSYEYGHVLCSYFYIYPKWPGLSDQTIAAFLCSNIGQQIVQLTFSNEIRKTKGNLSKILIPSFFQKAKKLPAHLKESFNLLSIQGQDLLTIHPSELEKRYIQLSGFIDAMADEYPAEFLESYTQFGKAVEKCLDIIGHSRNKSKVNFSNPLFKTPLLLSKKYSIYPDNQDIYVEFNSSQIEEIHRPLTKAKKTKQGDDWKLELIHQDETVITLHSEENMLSFIEFILTKLAGCPISKIIQSVQAPRLSDLNNIFDSHMAQLKTFEKLRDKASENFNQVLSKTIFTAR